MIMSMMYSWSQELARQVAAVDVPDDMRRSCVEAVQIRTMHMPEPAHGAAHLLNPRRRSLRYYESARRTTDLEVVIECDSFFLAQTGGDAAGDAYLRVRQQMRSFHSRVGHMMDRVTRDAEAEACAGDEETSRCASWWVEHGACFSDLQEIAGRVMHMWTSACPAEMNWAEHERIQTAKRNKLKFRKVAQLVEIASNLTLLGCSDHSGGSVLPWGHMATLAEARHDKYTHAPIDDRDEEEEPEPEEWGARPQSAVVVHEVSAQVRRFQQQGFRRPEAQTSEQESDSEDLPPGVDKSVERLYYTYCAGPYGFQSHCTVIQESDDDSFPASGGGTGGPTRRAARSASGGATGRPSGGATHDEGGRTLVRAGAALPAQPTAERERERERATCTDDDGEPFVFHRAHMASDRAPSATEGLRRSVRLQTLADSSTGARREPDDVRTEEAVVAVRMEGDSDEHGDGGRGPGAEADDGADTAGRLSPLPSTGPGPLSHGPIGGDDMDLQADDPEEVGGSMSLALVLWDPSPVAHDVPSEHVEGGGRYTT
ncbi:hypothetical protein CBR_g52275 [Chara braunii]|uniref:HAT C-terminal dimerisation domain-containing protein n=1 Tax=Chara braunii TaxID=69332 RepID=A0A388M9Z2_CHABU|nr:hypothetical protein CBR_g52275 [Chara braunii]|eukprot:GBG91388.1 hypothetical protein CBR_g52275 [Chara braunii]